MVDQHHISSETRIIVYTFSGIDLNHRRLGGIALHQANAIPSIINPLRVESDILTKNLVIRERLASSGTMAISILRRSSPSPFLAI